MPLKTEKNKIWLIDFSFLLPLKRKKIFKICLFKQIIQWVFIVACRNRILRNDSTGDDKSPVVVTSGNRFDKFKFAILLNEVKNKAVFQSDLNSKID